jgi:hypothetical protein
MTKPPKAKKSPRNQPTIFDESLMATLTQAPAQHQPSHTPSRLAARFSLRHALAIIWVAAAITGGIGLGRVFVAYQIAQLTYEPAVPVATASVYVASLVTPDFTAQPSSSSGDIAVTTNLSVDQAQAGQPFAVLASSSLQASSNTLQPGFVPYFGTQGTIGTDPIR